MKKIDRALLRGWPLPDVDEDAGKEGRGTALVVGGSEQVPGAVILAAIGALRAGGGKLQIATSERVSLSVATVVPEARVIGLRSTRQGELARGASRAIEGELGRCDALLVGPGMMDPRAAIEIITRALAARGRKGGPALIVDAAALEAFEERKPVPRGHRGRVVLTPHAGEMAKLWGIDRREVVTRARELAKEAAGRLGVVVALKGAETFVASPDGEVFHNTRGNAGLGTSGSGDALAGIIAGLCARGATPLQATVWGVHAHATAGEILAKKMGRLGFLARELLAEVPAILDR